MRCPDDGMNRIVSRLQVTRLLAGTHRFSVLNTIDL